MNLASDPAITHLALARAGDHGAFAGLVRQHQSMVYSMALNFLRNHAAAEELAQEVFLQLYRSMADIETPAHLMQWLRRVTSNRCIDQARRARYRPKTGLESAPEPVALDRPQDPLLSSHLERLIADLPERSRMVVVLRYQEEMEPAQIATTLGIPVGTVKSSLHRALAVLRGRLEHNPLPKGATS
jgi:RNA polymerase sigma-70 factor (ECF subfamily)